MMKMKSVLTGFLLTCLLVFSGCTDKIYEGDTIIEGAEIISEQIKVKKSDWKWNAEYNRYEALFTVPHLSEEVYEYGEVNVSIFWTEVEIVGGQELEYEALKFLPFTRPITVDVKDTGGAVIGKETFTQQFSFDYQTKALAIYITNSDNKQRNEYLKDYTIKISTILDSANIPQ